MNQMSGLKENRDNSQTAFEVVVSGRVQGVGYRFFCQRKARLFGIYGWAKNRSDGTVQVMAVGSSSAIQGFVAELERGPRFGKVEDLSLKELTLPDSPENQSLENGIGQLEEGKFLIC